MPERHLPVRPDLTQLKRQAKDFLRALHCGDATAVAEFREFHPGNVDPVSAKLSDAQLALARSYQSPSWPRLAQACNLIDAIWRDDLETARELVTQNRNLLHENARVRNDNWGPPMSYAANLGRERIIEMLHAMGASDHLSALIRAELQSQIPAARLLHKLMGSPVLSDGRMFLRDPAYTLSTSGTALALELGAQVQDEYGLAAPVNVVLETDSRNPEAKHAILEMYVQHGIELPDTPVMALHRGRIDLLEKHLQRAPQLLRQPFTYMEIFPPELGCHYSDEREPLATFATPLGGTTLLHIAIDYAELEIIEWLFDRGADVNVRAEVDPDGFGGHTPLFNSVVSQPNFWVNHLNKPDDASFTRLLLERGADPTARASLRKKLHPGYGPDTMHEYRNVTPIEWGERFHRQKFVSQEALRLIRDAGGTWRGE
jgi:ankyrin repeat protein